MREILEKSAKGHDIYPSKFLKGSLSSKVPFRVSQRPFELSCGEICGLEEVGRLTVDYVQAAVNLYREEQKVREILDKGKPEIFLCDDPKVNYTFVRPDLIVTQDGYAICEIETSPFGLALADILARGYQSAGFELVVAPEALRDHMKEMFPGAGSIQYSDHTSPFAGQMQFLANEIFDGCEGWTASQVNGTNPQGTVYRAFYLDEVIRDKDVAHFLADVIKKDQHIVPSLTPFFEEKAMLALLWDKRWSDHFRRAMGVADFYQMRRIVPGTWIVGEEAYFEPGMPSGISDSLALAAIAKSKRTFVLKNSGFSPNGSWGRGVTFLNEKSTMGAATAIASAQKDVCSTFVIQNFIKGKKHETTYIDEGEEYPMKGKVRLTPYVGFEGLRKGLLIAIKATICENTNYVHASSASINIAVARKPKIYF